MPMTVPRAETAFETRLASSTRKSSFVVTPIYICTEADCLFWQTVFHSVAPPVTAQLGQKLRSGLHL